MRGETLGEGVGGRTLMHGGRGRCQAEKDMFKLSMRIYFQKNVMATGLELNINFMLGENI